MDKGSLDWKISTENFYEIDDFFMNEAYKCIAEGKLSPMPKYSMKERYHGLHIIQCDTPRALEFLEEAISKMKAPWEGADLDIKRLSELRSLPKAFIVIPAKTATEDMVKTILQKCNPHLLINSWRLLRLTKAKKGRQIAVFRIDVESAKVLGENKEINFLLRDLTVHIQSYTSLTAELEDGAKGKTQELIEMLEESLDVGEEDDGTSN